MPNSEEYRDYFINPKRDFPPGGVLGNHGEVITEGFVVVDRATGLGCNVMPGATWFQTIPDAKEGIDALIEAGGKKVDSDDFWRILRAKQKDRRPVPIITDVSFDNTVKVWQFSEAPEELQKMSEHGGDEDLMVAVPADLAVNDNHPLMWKVVDRLATAYSKSAPEAYEGIARINRRTYRIYIFAH